jgi:hypothetical protein
MRELWTSAVEFFWGMLRHAYFWGFALFLDPIDLYSRVKPDKSPTFDLPDWIDWSIIAGLFFVSAVLTYHDLRSRMMPHATPNVTLRAAFAYIMRFSKWAGKEPAEIVNKIHDLLSAGGISAWGRDASPGMITVDHIAEYLASVTGKGRPLKGLGPDFWQKHKLEFEPAFDLNGSRNGIAVNFFVGLASSAADIHFSSHEILAAFPRKWAVPTLPWNHKSAKIWKPAALKP